MTKTADAKIPPQDIEAEKSLIGSALLDNRVMDDVTGIIKPHMFYFAGHEKIFGACVDQYQAREAFDAVTISKKLDGDSECDPGRIGDCLMAVPHAAHAKFYAEQVRDAWTRRKIIYGAYDAISAAHDMSLDAPDVIGRAESGLSEVSQAQAGQGLIVLRDVLFDVLDELHSGRDRSGLKTGFADLDELTGGLRGGQLVVIAGRPGMGKTSFAMKLASNVCGGGHATLVVSLEMDRLELVNRLLSIAGGIESGVLKGGIPNEIDTSRIIEAAGAIDAWPLAIDDGVDLTVQRIASAARVQKRRAGLELLIIDYLQLVVPEDRRVNREQQVATMTRQLKNLAKSLNVPIVLLCQLNRDVEKSHDHRPKLSNLRESGAIEQDADVVGFTYRPEEYDPTDRPGEAELVIAKQRNGPTGIVNLQWDATTMQFRDLERRFEWTPESGEPFDP